ncbi:MAG: hypothetical protein ACOCU9_01725 [Spirochaetota bacterium]
MTMREFIKRLAALVALAIVAVSTLGAQIMEPEEMPMPATEELRDGALTPYFWVGAQAIFGLGVNLNNGAFGIEPFNTSDTWASFNVALVDSLYATPKAAEFSAGEDMWTGHLALRNYTLRLNSYSPNQQINEPIWTAGIRGFGYRFGVVGQAGEYIQGGSYPSSITSGDLVLFFDDPNAQDVDFVTDPNPLTQASYAGTGLLYGGYEQADLFNAYLTLTTEGTVDDLDAEDADGIAGVLDFNVTPWGTMTDIEQPFTLEVTGNAMYGVNFEENPFGFGLKVEPAFHLQDYFVLTPIVAFEGQLPQDEDAVWAAGGGLMLTMSGKRFASDMWGERGGLDYFDTVYERDQILKYTYAQIYASYNETQDLDLAVKFDEPSGSVGIDEQLGAMTEFRLNNVLQTGENELGWSAVARADYELNNGAIIPSLRGYLDSENVLKVRAGVEMTMIPYAAFELAYTSANLNTAADGGVDYGRVNLTGIIKSDSSVRTPKDMNDWNYTYP